MNINEWMKQYENPLQLATLVDLNEKTQAFGLSLTTEDAKLLLSERKESLKSAGRVEFGGGILEKLIFAFCDSPYIYQSNYVETIGRLQDIFYQYKNELPETVSDEELLSVMEKAFNGSCQGSVDYLEETILANIARLARIGGEKYLRSRRGRRDVEDDV